jgi:hypothetical protein
MMDIKGNGLDYLEEKGPIDDRYKKLVEMQCDIEFNIKKAFLTREEAEAKLKELQE